jgi:FkbM family methyltransferase
MKRLADKKVHIKLAKAAKTKKLKIATFGMRERNIDFWDIDFINEETVIYNFDNNQEMWGTRGVFGVITRSPSEIKDIQDKVDALIVMSGSATDICPQLDDLGIDRYFRVDLFEYSEKRLSAIEEECHQVELSEREINIVKELLADDKSRKTYENVLSSRLSKEPWESFELLKLIYTGDMYFPKDIASFVFTEDEVFIDAGAYRGDTINTFIKTVNGRYEHIYAFEPDQNHYLFLGKNYSDCSDITAYPLGLYSHPTTLQFSENGDTSSSFADLTPNSSQKISANIIDVEVTSLDVIIESKVSFIKMDIEGSELSALCGAERIIKLNQPKLAICLYHKISDFWNIPRLLHEYVPKYSLYVRNHALCLNDTVMYAVVE